MDAEKGSVGDLNMAGSRKARVHTHTHTNVPGHTYTCVLVSWGSQQRFSCVPGSGFLCWEKAGRDRLGAFCVFPRC